MSLFLRFDASNASDDFKTNDYKFYMCRLLTLPPHGMAIRRSSAIQQKAPS
jgi:hypothetical protein